MNGDLKMNGIGNGPLAVLVFASSFGVSGTAVIDFAVRVLVMLLVALAGKALDNAMKNRRERWRRRALKAEERLAELKSAEKV